MAELKVKEKTHFYLDKECGWMFDTPVRTHKPMNERLWLASREWDFIDRMDEVYGTQDRS